MNESSTIYVPSISICVRSVFPHSAHRRCIGRPSTKRTAELGILSVMPPLLGLYPHQGLSEGALRDTGVPALSSAGAPGHWCHYGED
eukprot:gene1206-biopygen352